MFALLAVIHFSVRFGGTKRGVRVVSVSEPIEEGMHGKLIEGLIELMDEFYSENLSAETRRGMVENTKQGWRSGGTAPFGYTVVNPLGQTHC